MTDCLIVGFYDYDFERYVRMVAAMGLDSGAYRDLALAFVPLDGRPVRALDVMTQVQAEGHEPGRPGSFRPYHNTDFLWPTISYLGTFLARHGFTFDFVNQFHREREVFREKLLGDPPRTVAITTTLYVIPEPIVEIVEFVRRHAPGVTIIVGGPYVRNQTTAADPATVRQVFKYLGADVYVDSGEGELALTRVLAALREGRSLDGIANVAFRRGDEYVMNGPAVESNDLPGNQPDYTLFDRQVLGEFVSLRTAKSCPFACAFCGFPRRAGAYTYLPVELVERELDGLRDLGTVTTLTFLDDTFNVPKRRFKDLLRMMIRNRYPFRWNCFYRSDHGDEEAIALMRDAGCEGVFLGVESGSAAMLERMNKTARPDDYYRAIPRFREASISTYASLIIGYPGETFETVRETQVFLEAARPDFYRAQLWYADHQTPVWEKRDAFGIEGEGFSWRHRTMDSVTASDLVEKLFLAVQGSTWMPQNGFEQWSTFYLQRRGMSMAQIKAFLGRFNEVIKERLLHPDRVEPTPALVDALRRSARYDRPVEAADLPPERYPAGAYVAAERFWAESFAGLAGESVAETLADGTRPGVAGWREVELRVAPEARRPEGDAADSGGGGVGASVDGPVILAALAGVLSRVSGREDLALLVSLGPDGFRPLRLRPAWDRPFDALVQQAREAWARSGPHADYAPAILANPVRLREAGLPPPPLDVVLAVEAEPGPLAPSAGPPDTGWPGARARLVLRAALTGGALHLRLGFDLSRHAPEPMAGLLRCLPALLAGSAATLGALCLGPSSPTPSAPAPASSPPEHFDFT